MAAPGDFKLAVKHRLVDLDKTQAWLAREIVAKTGLYMDSTYLSKIISGKAKSARITAAIREILNLPGE